MFKKTVSLNLFQLITILLGVALLAILISNQTLQRKINLASLQVGVPTVSPRELEKMLTQKTLSDGKPAFFLVNVHTPYEGEIAKTDAFIKYDEIEKNLAQLLPDKSAKIVLYCQTGRMSEIALKKLKELGYTNVSHLGGGMEAFQKQGGQVFNTEKIQAQVLPSEGITLPLAWQDLGPRLVSLGVIDLEKFKQAVKPTAEQLKILTSSSSEKVNINSQNAQWVVDILWAAGLAQKSKVYTEGPMGKQYKNEVGNFASTGGWTLAKGKATDYLGRYELFNLSPAQQDKVYEITQNIYRPCCGNPASFPDCNHGMAALALVEMLVAQGWQDNDIYKAVLGFNSFWFPQTYVALAVHFTNQGISWDQVEPKKALGSEFSSAQGAGKIYQEVGSLPHLFGTQAGSCGA